MTATSPPCLNSQPRLFQSGQSITEFIIIVPVVLLLVLGTIQTAFVYKAKTTLNYAAYESARLGALRNATPAALERGLEQGLAPLFTHDNTSLAIADARKFVRQEITNGHIHIDRISPSQEAFNDFQIKKGGNNQIPNDHLMYRSAAVKSGSGVNIQDANLLKIKVTYCYPLYVPLINKFLSSLPSTEAECGIDSNRLPINAQAITRMQTPAYR